MMRFKRNTVVLVLLLTSIQISRFEARGLPKRMDLNTSDTCECGIHEEISGRIVGGNETYPNEYPWMVAIFDEGKLHCGGTLINDKYILTAGHCLKWTRQNDLLVVLGLHDKTLIDYQNKNIVIGDVESTLVHEDFASNYLYDMNDIGLIKLKRPVKFTPRISPICLPKNDDQYESKLSTVIGWGKTSENGITSRYLRKADITVLSNEECQNNAVIGEHVLKSMICAYNHQVDACQGDSGGPLISESLSGKLEQIGIVSWGIGCAKPGIPGVYSRVKYFMDWIISHTMDGIYCKTPE